MGVLFTSDLHLGHKTIPKYRDTFPTMEAHDEYILDKMSNLSKRHILYILGDFIFDGPKYTEYMARISEMPARFRVIMGNHDTLKLHDEEKIEILNPLYTKKHMWFSHAPIHPKELRDKFLNVHGHLHQHSLADQHYFNVNIDANEYEFVEFDTLKQRRDSNIKLSNIAAME